jgi:FdhD protein
MRLELRQMSDPQRLKTRRVIEWTAGSERPVEDDVAVEEPLEIRVGGASVSVTMRTPGDDFELAAGFLFTERIIEHRGDVAGIANGYGPGRRVSDNVVEVTLPPGKAVDLARLQRHFYAASSCGVCGKASICAVRVGGIRRPRGALRVDSDVLCRLPDVVRAAQTVFDRTGGLHAAALFDAAGTLLAIREDIGRHNAVDKIVGYALLEGRLPLSECVLFVSGRGAFEIVQKALVAGIPVIASVSAPSSLAVELAREHGLTLVGFLRGQRFIVYSGHERVASPYS